MKKHLMICFLFVQVSLSLAQTSFHYKRKLAPIEKEGWYSVVLPVDLFQHITNGYSDIRIIQINEKDSVEIPYLLRIKNDEISEGFIDLPVINQSKKDEKLYLTFKLNKGQEVNYIDLQFAEENYNGYVQLEGSNDQKEWFELVNHQRILAIKNNTVDFQFSTLNFPLTNYKFLRAAISNDKPLTFQGASFRTKTVKSGSFHTITPRLTTKQHKKEKQSTVEMGLNEYQPVSKVSINIKSQGDYYRSFTLETLRDSAQAPNQTWTYYYEPLVNGYLTSIEPNDFQFDVINARKLKLTIYNEDNAPLAIESITVSGPHVELVSQLKPGSTYLFYGNEQLSPPEYDLVHFTEQIPVELNEVVLEPEEKLIADKEKESPLMESKLWLWGAMVLIIGLLGFATLKMMSKK